MKLHSLRERALLVAPIRVTLGLVWVGVSLSAGAGRGQALLAAASAAFVLVFFAFNDPRSRFVRAMTPEAQPVPPDARVAPRLEQALKATVPSTVGVSVLAAIALLAQPILTAFLGGISIGLGAMGVLSAALQDPSLYVDPRTGTVYKR